MAYCRLAVTAAVCLLASTSRGQGPRPPAAEPAGLEAAAALENALVGAIARSEKSVVAIARVRKEKPGENFRLELRPDAFGRRLAPMIQPAPTDPDFVPNEYGTGVVLDPQGLILTAYHVLGSDSDYYVTTPARRVYRATIKGADPRSDLAVLAVEGGHVGPGDFEPISLGDADHIRKGQIVVALGNPYAIGRDGQASASWGIVSNLARKAPPLGEEADLPSRRTIHQFGTLIQTDARLNLGTSGGALLNLRGEMVGLTVALAATPGQEQAAGYAIPIDGTFRRVIDTLKAGREVDYGFLGVRPANLRPQELAAGRQGIRVQSVVPGTPAQHDGLRPDDLITAVSGRPVFGSDGLMLEVGRLPAGATARFDVQRSGHKLQLDVVLAKYPVTGKKVVTSLPPAWRGLRVDYTTALVDPETGIGGRAAGFDEGVAASEVLEGQPAWQAGLRRGMVINQVDETPVRSPGDFRAAVAGKKGPVDLRLAEHGEGQPSSIHVAPPGS